MTEPTRDRKPNADDQWLVSDTERKLIKMALERADERVQEFEATIGSADMSPELANALVRAIGAQADAIALLGRTILAVGAWCSSRSTSTTGALRND